MKGYESAKKRFPLQKIEDVVQLFKEQLTNTNDIDLCLLSIIIGTIENTLTVNQSLSNRESDVQLLPSFPTVEWDAVEVLYTKFVTLIKSAVDLSQYPSGLASRELVKKVSDVIWGGLPRAFYKDRAHLQSLFSFLTGSKLDCFGLAFAVVAAFQVLKYNDVHLVLSEDHSWVVFGEGLQYSAEVTWHGKGNEDKRGQPIGQSVSEKHWLYLNGHPVVCTLEMEVAAIVSAINPSITATVDSVQMGSLQQELLWLLYDLGHLKKYPVALGNLGYLEEICATPGRPPPLDIFKEGIESAKSNYNNQHIYPYTSLGGHLYRMGKYTEAIEAWAWASDVVKIYNYNREDEEIYKEFIEIANDWLPSMMRNVAMQRFGEKVLLNDSQVYANILKFYDGICQWEEDSPTPVLHTVWAKHLVFSLGKFDPQVRKCMHIHAEGEEDEMSSDKNNSENDENCDVNQNGVLKDEINIKQPHGRKPKRNTSGKHVNGSGDDSKETKVNGNKDEDNIKHVVKELVSKVGETDSLLKTSSNPNITALAQACSESILNPDYLLTGGEQFSTHSGTIQTAPSDINERVSVDVQEFLSSKTNGNQGFLNMSVDSMLKAESPVDMMMFQKPPDSASSSDEATYQTPDLIDTNTNSEVDNLTFQSQKTYVYKLNDIFEIETPKPMELLLSSQKMKGLRKLLSSDKLNSSAITLQLTAQSQTDFKQNKRGRDVELSHVRKRSRRAVI